ncbi:MULTISPECIES: acyl-ACP--UDP-N-acetylglucosamine O-acyltransferase [Thiomicrorhabdus]|uniref:Acyl-[acyl-carrier-protein]--UDP-N-acetylglucosamine O-acyltransferase n=1 Tax=Thiomicrorhabdus heinhorstiae TaxID=2748010 RepID=A0ABS0BSN4_9GAMM|nr:MULTISPECIES: acyl-ACP--UDP-N-acetylglucosamine O-acyltransferase [Thiomicrorhabdus]MBF6056824.1 acyl-ACP--UDP-N-acetylglucosamine O-acyltransferase [Thiomicrorhabdus heinhorstiae]
MIHSTAVIDPKARIAEGVKIGPYCVIEGEVTLGEGCILDSHVVIQGPTQIGKNNRFYPFGCIGAAPQDKKYRDEPTLLIIGDDNTFRENVTVNRGTIQDIGKTVIGNGNWIMAGVHIAHDCIVGNNCIFANAAALAGHVIVDDWAILGGYSLVHQFCRIGAHSFCGMGSVINQDVPNFVVVSGNLAQARGINLEGMKRRGFDSDQLRLVKNAYRSMYRSGQRLTDSIEELRSINDEKQTLTPLIDFLEESKRGIVR